jgi:hypothetical protein
MAMCLTVFYDNCDPFGNLIEYIPYCFDHQYLNKAFPRAYYSFLFPNFQRLLFLDGLSFVFTILMFTIKDLLFLIPPFYFLFYTVIF